MRANLLRKLNSRDQVRITVGRRMAEVRLSQRHSQRDAAKLIHTNQTTLARMEIGKKPILDAYLIARFCAVYDVSIDSIMFGASCAEKPLRDYDSVVRSDVGQLHSALS